MPGQYRLVWSTPGGGEGYSVVHFFPPANGTEAQAIADEIQAFGLTLVGYMPNEVSVIGDTEVLILDDVTGGLTGVFPVSGGAGASGTDAGTYNRAAGARIDWGTAAIFGGRRLRGRTYVVPLGSGAYDANGLVSAAGAAALIAAGETLRDDLSTLDRPLLIWSRVYGQSAEVVTVTCPDKGAILTGRRD